MSVYLLFPEETSNINISAFQCSVEGCGRKFTTVYNLNSHVRLHERPCSEVCPEPGCGASFPTKRKLDLHMKNHAGAVKTYKWVLVGPWMFQFCCKFSHLFKFKIMLFITYLLFVFYPFVCELTKKGTIYIEKISSLHWINSDASDINICRPQ